MKILVLGVTGMLGHKMYQVLNQNFPGQVWGSLRQDKSVLTSKIFEKLETIADHLNVENDEQLFGYLDQLNPDFIINCIGITLRKDDNQLVQKNLSINSLLPQKLSMWCESHKKKLIHFSTDCVFDGSKGNYSESDLPTAKDIYGASKFLGEVRNSKHTLTLRVSIVGRELLHKTELLEWFFSKKDQAVEGYSQVYYTGLTTLFLANEVCRLIKNFPNLSGLYQVSSEKISKLELLKLVNEIFKNKSEISDNSTKKSDKSLNCQLYSDITGFKKPNWIDMITAMQKENHIYTV